MQKKKMLERQRSIPDTDRGEQITTEMELRELNRNKGVIERKLRQEKKKEIRDDRAKEVIERHLVHVHTIMLLYYLNRRVNLPRSKMRSTRFVYTDGIFILQ